MMAAGNQQSARQAGSPGLRAACLVIAKALARMRTVATVLGSRWDAAVASCAPISHVDSYLPRHLRRRMMHGTRKVERAVIDSWLLWRM